MWSSPPGPSRTGGLNVGDRADAVSWTAAAKGDNEGRPDHHHARSDEPTTDMALREEVSAERDTDNCRELEERERVADLQRAEREQRRELHHSGRAREPPVCAPFASHLPKLRHDFTTKHDTGREGRERAAPE